MTMSEYVQLNLMTILSFHDDWTWNHTQVIETLKFDLRFKRLTLTMFDPVSGLAKIEGEVIDIEDNMYEEPATTKYQLTGIVVHSGQASGGHYFSFVLHK